MPGPLARTQRRNVIRWWKPPGEWAGPPDAIPAGLLSGSFNPLHAGHLQLQAIAAERLEATVGFEMSITNVEKAPLTPLEVERRCRQFDRHWVAVTAVPTFVEKSKLFSPTTFVVGADTAIRIVDPAYYQDAHVGLQEALKTIEASGCRFLVAGRRWRRKLLTLDDAKVPPAYRHLFEAIPVESFLLDISSTDLRGGA